jgi:ribosomal protein S27AE
VKNNKQKDLSMCPFCGFATQIMVDVPYESRVICGKCGASTRCHNTLAEAKYAWQVRHANAGVTPTQASLALGTVVRYVILMAGTAINFLGWLEEWRGPLQCFGEGLIFGAVIWHCVWLYETCVFTKGQAER